MYNRYIRNDYGTYTRIPEEEPRDRVSRPSEPPSHPPGTLSHPPESGNSGVSGPAKPPPGPVKDGSPRPSRPPPGPSKSSGVPPPNGPPPGTASGTQSTGGSPQHGLSGTLRRFLDEAHLEQIDSGDLLLLGLLFFLLREGADEELLVALGLLLIL